MRPNAVTIRSHKTNQPLDRQTVFDGIQVFARLELSLQKELYTAAGMAVLAESKHSIFPI